MRMTRDELETENARLQDVLGVEQDKRAALIERCETLQGMADQSMKRADDYERLVYKLREEAKELGGENRDLNRRLRAAEDAIVPIKESLHRCLGWIACKNNKPPLDDGMPF